VPCARRVFRRDDPPQLAGSELVLTPGDEEASPTGAGHGWQLHHAGFESAAR
jgi:hypothetical protein